VIKEYPPVLFIDDHEMGADDYFFPPNADPYYHDLPAQAVTWINGWFSFFFLFFSIFFRSFVPFIEF
jgi:hypothetical protein